MTSSTTNSRDAETASLGSELGKTASGAASIVQDAAHSGIAQATARMPDIAISTRAILDDANQQLRGESDEMLAVGSAMSFGFACGLLIGGGPRLVVMGALVPSAAMALTMFGRSRQRQRLWLAAGRRASHN